MNSGFRQSSAIGWQGSGTAWASTKLLWGFVVRTALQSSLFDGIVALVKPSSRTKRKNAFIRSLSFSCCEVGVSLILFPARYACCVTVARSLFEMALPGMSEIVAVFDGYDSSIFQYLSLQCFPEDLADLNFAYMLWQAPAMLFQLGLLLARRRQLGAARTRTKRVLGVMLLQLITRMYLTSFCVNPPTTEGDAVSATVFVTVGCLCQSYLSRHLWPWDDHHEREK